MEINNKSKNYRIRRLRDILRHGLFWLGVKNNLARIGFDIMPYYWEKGSTLIKPITIRGDESKYEFLTFGEEEITCIESNIIGISHKDLLTDLRNGDICLGLKYEGEIAAYSFIKCKTFDYRGRQFDIKPTDGYVHNTYTFEDFRGNNLAPYLRYKSYEYLKNKGVDSCYSISEYLNKSTLKYKEKLNVHPQKLYLSVILFKKLVLNFTLKSY